MPDQMGLGTIGSFAKPAKKEKVISDATYHYRYIDQKRKSTWRFVSAGNFGVVD